ncbi:REP-associated tyrosine transposase [Labrys monachus]|uniref:DNA methylase n=1 Tax=Labrys monachus TaxID=217067 RepID=A0ABU0FP25_9HYPH|nr:transposase [Labrys monachus]MDQ0396373.1 putative DNA methylase [Labrys monachus]
MSDSEWHSRGYLPHWEAGEEPQSITFRLADSLPKHVLLHVLGDLQDQPENTAAIERRKRIEATLDRGLGAAFLSEPAIASTVQNALLFFDSSRYRLHAWCIMPNHVHVLVTPSPDCTLSALVHSWKSFSALQINRLRGEAGPVWFTEYFDRKIRNERHFETARFYIEHNPVNARLCSEAGDWPFSSASRR